MSQKRKHITHKIKMQVFKRDLFTCKTCGRTPALNPGISLDIDHIKPHSKGGSIDISNLQILCSVCNRSKGNDEELNKTIQNEIDAIMNQINPEILGKLEKEEDISVVANETDFLTLKRLNDQCNYLRIEIIPNTIIGYHAGYNMGIYTVVDNGGSKINFYASKIF